MTTIIKSIGTKFGVSLAIDGVEKEITQKTTDGFYHLPENSICKYIMVDLVNFHLSDKDEFELNKTTSDARAFGVKNSVEKKKYPSGGSGSSKTEKITLEKVLELVDEETKAKINEVIEKYEKDQKRHYYEEQIRKLQEQINQMQG